MEKEPRRVPNPKRKALKQKLQAVSQEIEVLEAELGRALDQNDETKHRTARGLKIAHSHLRRRVAERRQVLTRLHNRLRHTPALIAATEVDKTRSLLREDRRLVVNPSSSSLTTPRDFLRFASTNTTDGARTPSASSGHYCSCQATFNACRTIVSTSNSSGPTPKRSPQLWKL